ncbi:anthrone oxygenase family protein [Kineosporia sp. NBRC 101731]|uniref:anthrone oxygenase family protein n=1 Tax=Kineosporia sp. NBRC 101731 TaxID=3032199 RepID=UPI0025560C75|nr:anthrone oxygenase family protein [Kineosporia sp. NBRC 101731]
MSELSRTGEIVVTLTALGCGLMAGVFFAFSGFVLAGLDRAGPGPAVAAMNGINAAAVRAPLMLALFGTAAGALAVTVIATRSASGGTRVWLIAGAVLYLAGVVLVTVVHHVPLNDALAGADPSTGQAADVADVADVAQRWLRYRTRWALGNHVRTVASLAAAGCLTKALSGG